MKIKTLFGLATAGILLGSCQSNLYQISGYAKGCQDGDTICLATDGNDHLILAQAVVCNGTFQMTGETDAVSLSRVFAKQNPECGVTFFLEPGHITIELNPLPDFSRVSGTTVNNEWQKLSDSISILAQDVERTIKMPAKDSTQHIAKTQAIDSLHRRMSACILHAGIRNKDNPLGQYIQENYKAPEFK